MLVLGLILILISAAALVTAVIGGNGPATLDLGVFETNAMGVFLIGAATVLLFVMGLELTRSGTRRANRQRKDRKELHRLSERYAEDTSDAGNPGDRDRTGSPSEPE